MLEYVLWGRKPDAPEWASQVLAEVKDQEALEQAKKHATEQGYVSLRVLEYRGEAPDFTNVFNTGKAKR